MNILSIFLMSIISVSSILYKSHTSSTVTCEFSERRLGDNLLAYFNNKSHTSSAVTYEFSGGRLGDNLLAYFHTKWVAYKFNIPLLLKNFPYAEELVLFEKEEKFSKQKLHSFKKKIKFSKYDIPTAPSENTLYIIPFFGELEEDHAINPSWPYFKVDWQDKNFRKEIQNLVKPIQKLKTIPIPKNKISIALHIRSGRGYEDDLYNSFPLKCPRVDFYINALKKALSYLTEKSVYIFLFTDDPRPHELVETLKKETKDIHNDIEWNWRHKNNKHNLNVLEDFFSMLTFDCLIRSESHFSFCAGKLADYLIEISPKTHFISQDLTR